MIKKRRRSRGRSRPAGSHTDATLAEKPRRIRAWVAGVAASVVGGAAGGLVAWTGPEVVDDAGARDAVRDVARSDSEIRYTVTFQDPAYDLVLPVGVELTGQQKSYLDRWNLDYKDPSGYNLERLIHDLRARGGANLGEQRLVLTLEGRRNQPIHVDDVRPINVRRAAPYAGTFLNIPPQDGGFTAKMFFNFDELNPRARTVVDDGTHLGKPGGLYFEDKTLTIRDAEQDTISIRSKATRWAVTFDIQIDYRIGDDRRQLFINNNGRPFAISPLNCLDYGKLGQNGQLGTKGHASYQYMWQLRSDFQGVDPVQNPTRFETYGCAK